MITFIARMALGVWLTAFAAGLALSETDAGLSDDVAATVAGGQTGTCPIKVKPDLDSYACGGSCLYGTGTCPKIISVPQDSTGTQTGQTVFQGYTTCYTCGTGGQYCGANTIWWVSGCAR